LGSTVGLVKVVWPGTRRFGKIFSCVACARAPTGKTFLRNLGLIETIYIVVIRLTN